MLSLAVAGEQLLSDTTELPGFCLSSASLERLHLNLRLTTLARTITTTTRMTMKLMTPNAAIVRADFSSVGAGSGREGPVLQSEAMVVEVTCFEAPTAADVDADFDFPSGGPDRWPVVVCFEGLGVGVIKVNTFEAAGPPLVRDAVMVSASIK